MPFPLTIGGKATEIAWTQETAKRYTFRSSKLGVDPLSSINNAKKRESSLITLLWLVLPQDAHLQFSTPEDLHVAINHDNETEKQLIASALAGVLEEMFPDAEKKITTKKSHS
jgi:hypothetical protein